MKQSYFKIRTDKNAPHDADSANAKLLVRGGFIQKEMAGVYTFLPIGLRVLRKVENIVREEMNNAEAIEVLMSELAPKENWQKTGRWDSLDVLYKLESSLGKEVALCPTHEETVTPLVKNLCRSHKDFPVCVYQIQSKFRNEPRAKSGLLRGREFTMKDAYSFHKTQEDLENYYEVQKNAYMKVFERLGIGDITFYVMASGGSFSRYSHEFQTKSDVGEDLIFHVKSKDIYFNKEIAPSKSSKTIKKIEMLPMEDIKAEGIIGVEMLSKHLKIPVEQTTKTMLYETDKGEIIAAVVRGDYDVNETKLTEAIGCKSVKLASEEAVQKSTEAKIGYAGVINLPKEIKIIWDDSMENVTNFETGTNKTGYHTVNVNFERDVTKPEKFHDIKTAGPGDIYPETGEEYETFNAIEVGNIFPLGSKYSSAFDFKFTDEDGKQKDVIMGCYGIGITRLIGVIAEIFNDENGIIWPKNIAPFHVHIISLGENEKAFGLEKELEKEGIEVLVDDRDESAGKKFADADLVGIPLRLVISKRTLENKSAEWKERSKDKPEEVKISELVGKIKKWVTN